MAGRQTQEYQLGNLPRHIPGLGNWFPGISQESVRFLIVLFADPRKIAFWTFRIDSCFFTPLWLSLSSRYRPRRVSNLLFTDPYKIAFWTFRIDSSLFTSLWLRLLSRYRPRRVSNLLFYRPLKNRMLDLSGR